MHESTNRCNGHIQVSGIGKTPNRHRDRKGCKKGKIEMIMKNSMGATAKAPKLQHHHQLATAKKSTLSKLFGGGAINNHHQLHVINSGSVIKNEIIDDPYTFTDSEPQSLGLYSATNCLSSTRKVQSVPSPNSGNSAAAARKVQAATALATAASGTTTAGSSVVSRNDAVGKSMRSVATSVDPMIAAAKTATISQLQPDIARNRVAVVKRRKVVPPAPPPPQPSHPPPPYLQHLLSLTNHQHQQEPTKSSPSSSSSSSQRHNPPPPAAPPLARVSLPAKRLSRQTTWQRERRTRHELLQRIQEAQQQLHVEKRDLFPLGLELSDSEEESDMEEPAEVYQRHWFMDEVGGGGARGRESRLAQVNAELRRRLRQAWRGVGGAAAAEEPPPALVRAVVAAARSQPNATTLVLEPKLLASYSKQSRAKTAMLGRTGQCSLCARRALPCTRHCAAHIMYNVDQLLFAYCTAKLADHTQCRVPVFDVRHHMPLCPLHATNNTILTKPLPDTTPKRSRKRTKPSTLNRSRSKKKKKSRSSTTSTSTSTSTTAVNFVGESAGVTADVVSSSTPTAEPPLAVTTLAPISNVDTSVTSISGHDIADVFQAEMHSDVPQVEIEVQLDGEVPEEVLAIASMDPAELASQATKLLEDHEFTNMLLTPDFNDLFTEDKNGQYEPTKEETEELERALEAVDKDVRSLERTLTSRTGLAALPLTALPLPLPLESLLDDATAPLLVAAPSLPPPPPYSHHFAAPPTNLTNS